MGVIVLAGACAAAWFCYRYTPLRTKIHVLKAKTLSAAFRTELRALHHLDRLL